MSRVKFFAFALLALLVAGCSGGGDGPSNHNHGVYMLIDTSGTYTKEIDKAHRIVNFILAKMQPGDSFAVARIDTGSFSEKDIIAKVTFDNRPSTTNHQKRFFKEEVDDFVARVKPASYTDITGGILQATEFLNEKKPGRKTILVFSDLKEDLEKGYVRDIEFSLNGFDVVALNVTKLKTDNINPQEYINRLEMWQARVEAGGGSWKVVNDMDQLEKMFSR
jgi:hypothetical protein